MASRRGAVKVNPVTGKMERVDPASAADGKHTDGSLRLDNRYVNAAKDLGLGGDAGMYSHISSLARAGGGSADIPTGSSIESSASARAREAAASARPAMGTVDPKNTDAAMAAIRTTVTTVGRAKIAGFASGVRSSSEHNHADAFQRRKGVVNTVGGAKDITRVEKGEAPKLPPRGPGGAAPGARIATFDTLETTGAEGKARAEGRARREAAEAKMAAGAAGRHDLGGKPVSAPHSTGGGGGGASARGGGGHASSGGFGAAAPLPPRRPLIQPSTVSNAGGGGGHAAAGGGGGATVVRASGGSHTLGGAAGKAGGAVSGGPATAAAVAAKRAEFFEAKFKEEQAKKAAARAATETAADIAGGVAS